MKKSVALMLAVLTLFCFSSCGIINAEKDFTFNGMTITLTNLYTESDVGPDSVSYVSLETAVVVVREDFETYSVLEDYTIEEYADAFLFANPDIECSDPKEEDGIVFTEFTLNDTTSGDTYKYYTTFHKSDDALWTIKYGCLESEYESNKADFIAFAKTVRFE